MGKKKQSSDTAASTEVVREDDDGAEVGIDALANDVEELLRKQLDELEELIGQHPLATIGIAAGIGLIVGVMLGRR